MDSLYFNLIIVIIIPSIIFLILYFSMCSLFKIKFLESINLSIFISLITFIILSIIYSNDIFLTIISLICIINIFYIFSVIIYTPKSSIRFKILNIIYNNNNKISYSNLINAYNDKIIYYKRLNRLIDSKTITETKKSLGNMNLKGKFILFIYKLIKYFLI